MILYKHQLQAVKKLKPLKYTFDGSQTGLGKTAIALTLIIERNCSLNLIICPPISLKVWEREINNMIPGSMVVVLNKGSKKNKEILRDIWKAQKIIQLGVKIFIIVSFDSIWRMDGDPLKYFSYCQITIDEAHSIANTSKRTKYILAARKKDKKWQAIYKHIMSATLVTNNLMSLFNPFQFLSSEILGGNYYQLRERYFYKANDFLWVPKPNTKKEIMEKIEPYTVRFLKKDCLDLPPITHEQIDMELSSKESKAYKEIKEELITEIENQKIVIFSKLTATNKLLQISSGFIYDDNKKAIVFGDTKLKALKTLLEGISGQVIIFTIFRESVRRIAELDDTIQYTGKVEELDEFVSGKYKNIVMNETQARSINLQNANNIIYFERNFSFVDRDQSEGRISRIGQKNDKLTIFDLFSSPIEKYVYNKVKGKKKINDSIPVSELVKNI